MKLQFNLDSPLKTHHRGKGTTLIEMIIIITLFSLSISFVYYNYLKFKENNELHKGKLILVNTISRYRDLAYYNNTSYIIKLDFIRKNFFIYDGSFNEIIALELPKTLKYRIIDNDHSLILHITNITPQGNLGSAFTIYIFDYNNLARYRIAFYPFSQIKYLSINIYKNHSASDATFDTILFYHSTKNAQNHVGWIKE